ncbi:MAG: LPS assembly protein LptD [Verrucomicrobiota bacterium]
MTRLPAIFLAALALLLAAGNVSAQSTDRDHELMIRGTVDVDLKNNTATFTNGAEIVWYGAVMNADRGLLDRESGEIVAEGNVRIQQDDQLWAGDRIFYNFKTHQMSTAQFRTGKSPVFATGRGLRGDITNNVYYATNAFVTTDDYSEPDFRIRASHIRLIPGKRIVARNATLWLGNVPVFYFPYYSRNLGSRANNFNFTPGYGSLYGAYLLTDYTWFWNDEVDGKLRLDYRTKRGVAFGPDLNLHLGRWGELGFRFYYLADERPGTNIYNMPIPANRERVTFTYQATPWTNFNVKARLRYQSDTDVLKTFYQGEYRENPQPDSFIEFNKTLPNFSLDLLAHPRLNGFLETIERLPDVRLTGFRQQIGASPLYYESESSMGYYRRLFADTNIGPAIGLDYEAARADTYQQITLPQTYFGWLNFTPRVGGRFTYYSRAQGPGGITEEAYRGVFNTGAEISFKASRVWPQAESKLLDLDGVRHIIQPSVNYVYVPRPNALPSELPQFDYELPSLRQLPIEYPNYNAIDAIDSQNVFRLGLNNRLQTKRNDRIEDFLKWDLVTDLRMDPGTNQGTFSDLYSDLTFRPRSWLRLESQTRYDLDDGGFRMLLHTVTFEPNNVWSWTVGHFYLRDDLSGLPTSLGRGNNVITSSLFYRVNENWGFRGTHHFDARNGRMQEQYYTLYRDLRSWTVAVTGGVRDNGFGPTDYNVAFTFSLKALPRNRLGADTVRPYSLLGQ